MKVIPNKPMSGLTEQQRKNKKKLEEIDRGSSPADLQRMLQEVRRLEAIRKAKKKPNKINKALKKVTSA